MEEIYNVFIYFVYGLVFFTMGNGLLVQYRQFSYFNLAVHLKWLGWFGVIHGLAEWAHMFSTLGPKELLFNPNWLMVEPTLQLVSFLFLLMFATQLYTHTTKKFEWLRYIPSILLIFWLGLITIGREIFGLFSVIHISMILVRYFICFPGSLLAAYSFILQSRELKDKEYHGETKYIYGVAFAFILYAFFAGLITREYGFLLSRYLNYKSVEQLLLIPVPVFRALAGIMMAYFTIKVMSLFNLEYSNRLENAEKEKMLLQERERISRNLHDGIIQTLYGIGLVLEHCLNIIKEREAIEQIRFALQKLNGASQDIRYFIMSLKAPQFTSLSFKQLLSSQLQFFSKATSINIEVNNSSLNCLDFLNPEEREHLFHIFQEVLANISKYATARNILIYCNSDDSLLKIVIEDDGSGISENELKNYNGNGLGLRNITIRTDLLKGTWNWCAKPGEGSIFTISLSKKGR